MKRLIVIFALLLMLALPVMAQDGEGTLSVEPVAAATVEAPAPAPVIEAPAMVNEGSADPAITLKWWQVLAGLAAAFSVGGAAGISGAGVIAKRVKNDPATMAAIEGLAKSVPENVALALLKIARSGKEVADLTEEAFDGVPASSKAAPAKTPG